MARSKQLRSAIGNYKPPAKRKKTGPKRTNLTLEEILGKDVESRRSELWIKGSQALRISEKFGGVSALAYALTKVGWQISPSTVYRWLYRSDSHLKGTNGRVPAECMDKVLEAARLEGIYLTPEDLDPRVNLGKYE